jgi:HEAT repeat protein
VGSETRSTAWAGLVCTALAAVGVCGCGAWDEITVKEPFKDKVHRLFGPEPDPLVVLRDSADGHDRARALRALREPSRYGGSAEDQDAAVKILASAASTERFAACRLAAIQTLRQYRDPRTVKALEDAYYRAGSFGPEIATVIRCQALEALGDTGQSAAVEVLVRVLKEPPVAAEGSETEKLQKNDERLAAARALGKFRHYQATAALVQVLRSDEDIAMRSRAHESLREATGQDLPADAQAWADYLSHPRPEAPESGGLWNKVVPADWRK